jgi:serine/threonine protein kinase
MGKVFTIVEGLENMGALKTGGQGSVYKGKRSAEIITAVKLLPTPIDTEDPNNKHYTDFQNEVQKLKKVNEEPNPNIVRILSSGITETGGFPFIEMEFIEGPDLGELLKPPHDPVFSIKETIKLAEQLGNALAHCHKQGVKHGDIKSNNVKYNVYTGNYMLLDFGLAVMSDEQRRTSLRHAGAIEFMAPEQNEGQMLFQTDVYSFGVILFELLAGKVPFPLQDSGETARNAVRLAHIEQAVPDAMKIREENLPSEWPQEKKQLEMQVPVWLTDLIYKCLEKIPENRFASGQELYEYIILNSSLSIKKEELSAGLSNELQDENEKLFLEKDQLQQLLLKKEKELTALTVKMHSGEVATGATGSAFSQRTFSRTSFYSVLVMAVLLGSLAAYGLFFRNNGSRTLSTETEQLGDTSVHAADSTISERALNNTRQKSKKKDSAAVKTDTSTIEPPAEKATQTTTPARVVDSMLRERNENTDSDTSSNKVENEKYKVRTVAYFHNKPDESTRRNAFINHWNNAVLKPRDEKNGFIYIVYTNDEGQTSKGWLNKKDLIPIGK